MREKGKIKWENNKRGKEISYRQSSLTKPIDNHAPSLLHSLETSRVIADGASVVVLLMKTLFPWFGSRLYIKEIIMNFSLINYNACNYLNVRYLLLGVGLLFFLDQ